MKGNRVDEFDAETKRRLGRTLETLCSNSGNSNNSNRTVDYALALRRYLADENEDENLGDKGFGKKKDRQRLSKFNSTLIADQMTWLMPDLLRTMLKQVGWVEVLPTERMPEEVARVASQQVEKKFAENDPLKLFDNYVQTGLLMGNGFLLVQLKPSDKKKVVYHSLNTKQYNDLMRQLRLEGNDEKDIHTDTTPNKDKVRYPDGFEYRVECLKEAEPRLKVEACPPEAVLVPDATDTIDQSDTSGPSYIAVRMDVKRSELIRLFPEKRDLITSDAFAGPTSDSEGFSEVVEQERLGGLYDNDDEMYAIDDEKMEKKFTCHDEYVRYDLDGDGIAELVNVFRSGRDILYISEVENNPLAPWSAWRVPNRFRAKGLSQRVGALQELHTQLIRSYHDAVGFNVFPLRLVDGTGTGAMGTTSDDFLRNYGNATIGSVIKTPGEPNKVVGQVDVDPRIPQTALEGVRFTQDLAERRTGAMTPMSDGRDASYQRTATGQHIGQQREQVPIEYLADNLAEGLKIAARKVYKMLIENFDYEVEVGELSGEDGPFLIGVNQFDPEAEIKVNMGGAMQNKDTKISHLMTLFALQEKVVAEYGPNNPFVKISQIANTALELSETMGFPAGDAKFFNSVSDEESAQMGENTQQDPKMAEVELKREEMMAKLEMDRVELQNKMDLEYQQFLLEQWKVSIEAGAKNRQMEIEALLKAKEIEIEARLEKLKIDKDAEAKKEQAKISNPVRMGGKIG